MIRVDNNCEYHPVVWPEEWLGRGILFAGPWIGEFGWELARWQGAVRKRSEESGLYTIVMSRPGHQVLYQGFADDFWELPQSCLNAGLVPHCDHVRPAAGNDMTGARVVSILETLSAWIRQKVARVGPLREVLSPRKFRPEEQTIVKLSAPTAEWSEKVAAAPQFVGYYCVLPRVRSWNPEKNWPAENWRGLCTKIAGLHLVPVPVGGPDEVKALVPSAEISEADALTRSIDLLTHARFAIAPESGGALLSLMCGCPTLVFGHERQRVRITKTENFLGTKVKYLSRTDYDFSIDEVAEGATALLQEITMRKP